MVANGKSMQAFLKGEFASEAAAGFPRLSRVPATNVFQFLDYFDSLAAPSRDDLLDALSIAASLNDGADIRPFSPAVERMRTVLAAPGPLSGGWRYTGVRFLESVPRHAEFGGIDNWLGAYTGLALQPRADLLPETRSFVAAKAPLLRRLVTAVLTRRGFAPTRLGGAMRYLASSGVLVDCDFGSRMGQLRWLSATGAIKATHGLVELRWFSYEGLWGLRSDWDYLTEENAERCIEVLPSLIAEAIRLRTGASSDTG